MTATHSVFGTGTPPYTASTYADGTPNITVGNYFCTTGTGSIGWRCRGARLYIPVADGSVNAKSVTLYAWRGNASTGAASIADDTPIQQKTVTTPATAGWIEVEWDEPFILDYGWTSHVLIGYSFSGADAMRYIYAASPGTGEVDSLEVGTLLKLAESPIADLGSIGRGAYLQGTAGGHTAAWYGVDVIMDEGPDTLPLPTAAYGFNELNGTTTSDASGNGHDLTVLSSANFADGHTGNGLYQVGGGPTHNIANSAATWLDTDYRTMMFWARYENDLPAPASTGVIYETHNNQAGATWSIEVSDGTNASFIVRANGFTITQTVAKQPVGEWHHYVLTHNESYARAYLDGVMVSEAAANGAINSVADDHVLYIFGGDDQQITLDDLRFFDYPLTASQVQAYMDMPIQPTERSGRVKVWDGAAWNAHPLKVWDGSSWITRPANGTTDGINFIRGKG